MKLDVPPITKIISAMFLVGGTCMGGGMLALPIATGISGFIPSLAMMSLCWLAMTATALMLLEVSLWMEPDAHIITMTSRLLGKPGKVISWCLYLFICYASIAAYTAGGGGQIASHLQRLDFALSKEWGCVIFIFLFGFIIYLGTTVVGRVNSILFIGMIASYVGLVGLGVDEIHSNYLLTSHWPTTILAIPLLLTSFSFQTMVPSLTPYLKRNAQSLRWAIIGGTSIAFLIYAIWEGLMLGIVPLHGSHGLAEALAQGVPATQFVREHVTGRWVVYLAEYFAFFAIVTSFLGIALGLFDFLSDGLKIKKEGSGQLLLGALIIIPTLIFSTQFERVFLLALDATGGYGDSILNGIIPVLMVWVGRYHLGYSQNRQIPGGKLILSFILAFFIFALILEILAHTGTISSIYDAYDLLETNIPELKEY
jgi:tyrosine-specific transport protein